MLPRLPAKSFPPLTDRDRIDDHLRALDPGLAMASIIQYRQIAKLDTGDSISDTEMQVNGESASEDVLPVDAKPTEMALQSPVLANVQAHSVHSPGHIGGVYCKLGWLHYICCRQTRR